MVVEGRRGGREGGRGWCEKWGGGFGRLFIGGGSKKGWEVINAVKKRGKIRFFDLTTDKICGANHRP